MVIDAQGMENTGFVESNNAYSWKSKGAAGVVQWCCRDTDELIIQKVPVYPKYRGAVQAGRIESGMINRPVTVGG